MYKNGQYYMYFRLSIKTWTWHWRHFVSFSVWRQIQDKLNVSEHHYISRMTLFKDHYSATAMNIFRNLNQVLNVIWEEPRRKGPIGYNGMP